MNIQQIVGFDFVVHNFREQFRFPRSKKVRIREKWANRDENYRPLLKKCVDVGGVLFIGPDVLEEIRKDIMEESK